VSWKVVHIDLISFEQNELPGGTYMKRVFVCSLALALLVAVPALAGRVDTIERGIDVWWTEGDGSTFVDFATQPIPKGFFCPKSEAFRGRLVLKGRPLATGNPGELGGADTIVQRLDNATFNKNNVAVTRIQMRALQLESVSPLKTICGDYNVRVVTDGQQPITKMRIIRETETGGRFIAPLRVKFKMIFTAASGISARRLELSQSFQLLPAPNAIWGALRSRDSKARTATLLVDADGDLVPETALIKTSGNFLPNLTPERAREMNARFNGLSKTASPGCGGTVNYEGYGDYGCHTGSDPSCHPETEGSSHCSRSCEPCTEEAELPAGPPG
jgi:hypothetical protein